MRRLIAVAAVALMVLVAGGAAADTFAVTVVSQTSSTITLGWTPQPGYGYLFSSGGVLRSRTNNANASSTTFTKVTPASYDIDVIVKGNSGRYQPALPVASITQTIVNGSIIANITGWRAVYDANNDGVEDDPGSVRFLIDGTQVLSEINAPFGDTFATGSPSTTVGQHSFRVDAINGSNVVVATNTVTATVGSTPPPVTQCSDGIDNDGDTFVDLSDPGCSGPTDNDESNVTPTGCALPAFPDASCTGVPAGTVLTASGGLTISTSGTVINGRDITGQVVVNAPNVTIRNTRIRSNSMWVIDNNSTGLVVEDSEIINLRVAGQNNCHNGIGNSNFTVRRTEITGCENSMNIDSPGNVTFTDNYVHDLDTTGPSYVWGNDPHTDGIQVGQGAANLVIRHNTIDPVGTVTGGGATSAIILYTPTSGTPNSNVWIEDNYLDGRDAATAVYAPRVQTHDVYINRNKMFKGVYGTYTFCVRVGVTVTQFNGNTDAGTGAAISPDNGVGGGCTN